MFLFNTKDSDPISSSVTDIFLKSAAYKLLIRCNISNLPVNYKEAFNTINNTMSLATYSYQFVANNGGDTLDELFAFYGYYGAVFFSEELSRHLIYYNEDLPKQVINWVMLNLLAYIELGLVPSDRVVKVTEDSFAEEFAYYFAAPDLILEKCGAKTSSDIVKLCNLPLKEALKKKKKYKKKFFSNKRTSFDILLESKFKKFIDTYK